VKVIEFFLATHRFVGGDEEVLLMFGYARGRSVPGTVSLNGVCLGTYHLLPRTGSGGDFFFFFF
jgi:hypothetical protein